MTCSVTQLLYPNGSRSICQRHRFGSFWLHRPARIVLVALEIMFRRPVSNSTKLSSLAVWSDTLGRSVGRRSVAQCAQRAFSCLLLSSRLKERNRLRSLGSPMQFHLLSLALGALAFRDHVRSHCSGRRFLENEVTVLGYFETKESKVDFLNISSDLCETSVVYFQPLDRFVAPYLDSSSGQQHCAVRRWMKDIIWKLQPVPACSVEEDPVKTALSTLC